ncbi:MAG: caspase family protein, partial [Armatimonadota bacterium]
APGIRYNDTNGNWDVFVVDTLTKQVWSVCDPLYQSTAPSGDSNTGWGSPGLSADGRYVVFKTNNYSIFSPAPAANTSWQVVLYDLVDSDATVISSPSLGVLGNKDSGPAAISANGDRVAFLSEASNLVGGDTNSGVDVFARRTSFAIYGKVETPAEKPLAYTSVVAINKDTKAERWVYCGVDGRYCISGLYSGDYDVWAYKAGYRFAPASQTLTLNALTRDQDFVGRTAAGDGVVTYRALIVGISKYVSSSCDLKYCAQDALDVRSALLTGANWKAANIQLLLDKAATRDAAKKAIADLMARCDGDDVCLLWWASHGTQVGDHAPFDETDGSDEALLPADGKEIVDDVFGHWLNRCGTTHYVLGLDCCHSGGQIVNLGVGKSPASAGDWLSGFLSDFRGTDSGVKDLNDNHCGAVLAAASPNETSQESPKYQNGVFTHFVVQGVGNRAADTDEDAWISPREMMAYARQPTIDANTDTGQRQTPMQFSANGALDLTLIGAKK